MVGSTEADMVLGGTVRDIQAMTMTPVQLTCFLRAVDPATLELVDSQAVTWGHSRTLDVVPRPLPVKC